MKPVRVVSAEAPAIPFHTNGMRIGLLGGSFNTVAGVARSNLARLNSDGSVDGSYAPNPNGTVNAISIS